MRFAVIASVSTALALAGCAGGSGLLGAKTFEDTYAAATPDRLASRIEVVDDPVEGFRSASSRQVGRNTNLELRPWVWATQRGEIASVSIIVETLTTDWTFPVAAYVGTPSIEARPERFDLDVDCGGLARSCDHREKARLALSADDVRALIGDSQNESIQIRVVGSRGSRLNGSIRKAELIATLEALGVVDRFR